MSCARCRRRPTTPRRRARWTARWRRCRRRAPRLSDTLATEAAAVPSVPALGGAFYNLNASLETLPSLDEAKISLTHYKSEVDALRLAAVARPPRAPRPGARPAHPARDDQGRRRQRAGGGRRDARRDFSATRAARARVVRRGQARVHGSVARHRRPRLLGALHLLARLVWDPRRPRRRRSLLVHHAARACTPATPSSSLCRGSGSSARRSSSRPPSSLFERLRPARATLQHLARPRRHLGVGVRAREPVVAT